MPNHASTALCHPLHVRALSLKEYAAIQEFPADWQFVGTPAQQYAQVGNAVPVRLGAVIGETIATALDAAKARSWRSLKSQVDDFRIVYLQSHIRTRQWFKEGETKVWDDKQHTRPAYAPPVTKRRERAMAGR
jgi:DNA (cytosine-5)-methyltransferase 1